MPLPTLLTPVSPWAIQKGERILPFERSIALQGERAWDRTRGKMNLGDIDRARVVQVGLGLDGIYNVPGVLPERLEVYVDAVRVAYLETKHTPDQVGRAVYNALIEAGREIQGKPLRALVLVAALGAGFVIWQSRKGR